MSRTSTIGAFGIVSAVSAGIVVGIVTHNNILGLLSFASVFYGLMAIAIAAFPSD